MPILQSNTKDKLQDIYAPSYLHNRYVGKTVGLNYFGYPSDTTQYNATAPYSTKIQRDIDLAHKTWALAEVGMYIVAGQTTWLNTIFTDCLGLATKHQSATKALISPGRLL